MRNVKVLGISVVILIILFVMIVLINIREPEIPEKPVFIIKDQAVKEDLIEREILKIYPNGTQEINIKEIQRLIEEGVYRQNPDGTIELTKDEDT